MKYTSFASTIPSAARLNGGVLIENRFHVTRELVEPVDDPRRDRRFERAPCFAEAKRQQVLTDEHRQVSLRRSDRNLGARPGVQHVVGLTAERAPHDIGEREEP